MQDFSEKLSKSLIENDTDANRKFWANLIVQERIKLLDLTEMLFLDIKLATRFIWLVGDLCELNPKVVFPAITHFYTIKKSIRIKNYNRSLAKMFWLCGVPSEVEGPVTSDLFSWVSNPNEIITTKTYSIRALFRLYKKYPELKSELRLAINEQLERLNSVSFRNSAERILIELT